MAFGKDGSWGALVFALLISFGYGALHTLGPGHGKAVVASYFVGSGGGLARGMTMGTRIAIFHVLSSVIVVFLLDFAVRQTTGSTPSDYRAIRLGSYALIVLIGAVMLWQAVKSICLPVTMVQRTVTIGITTAIMSMMAIPGVQPVMPRQHKRGADGSRRPLGLCPVPVPCWSCSLDWPMTLFGQRLPWSLCRPSGLPPFGGAVGQSAGLDRTLQCACVSRQAHGWLARAAFSLSAFCCFGLRFRTKTV